MYVGMHIKDIFAICFSFSYIVFNNIRMQTIIRVFVSHHFNIRVNCYPDSASCLSFAYLLLSLFITQYLLGSRYHKFNVDTYGEFMVH